MIKIIIFILFIIVVIESVIIYRKIKQHEKYQEILELYESWIENFALTVETIDEDLDRLDYDGTFRSDDEIGFFYQAMYSILKRLSEYGLTDTPQQIPEELNQQIQLLPEDAGLYTKMREHIKRVKRRRDDNIEIEDIRKTKSKEKHIGEKM